MKKILLVLFAFVSVSSYAQWETITGNGNIQKDTRQVSAFDGVSLAGSMNVELSYGNSNTITVEGDENILPYIETKVEDGVLKIRSRNKTGFKTKTKLMVYVSLTKLTELRVSGSGNIKGDGDFNNDGKTHISVSGSGNIDLGMNSFAETKINVSGSGNVTVKGKSTNNIDATISGSGNIDCAEVQCNDVSAHVSGSGNIRVYANKSIDARVSGSGNIYYKGSATQLSIKSSGSGKIIKA